MKEKYCERFVISTTFVQRSRVVIAFYAKIFIGHSWIDGNALVILTRSSIINKSSTTMSGFTSRRKLCEICEHVDNSRSRFQRHVPLSTNHTFTKASIVRSYLFCTTFQYPLYIRLFKEELFEVSNQILK